MNTFFTICQNLTFSQGSVYPGMIGDLIKLKHLVWPAADSARLQVITALAFSI